MKLHPELTPDKIIEMMLQSTNETLSRRVDGQPESHADRVSVHEQMRKMINDGAALFQCIGCNEPVAIKEAACCECGGFVCPACRRVEEEGICDHEIPDYVLNDDDEDDDELDD